MSFVSQLRQAHEMTFEERQKYWKGNVREFRQHHGRTDRPMVWLIWVQGDRVYTRHGLLDGAMQDTSYVGKAKNVGRSNAITAEEDALAEARRDCRKKYDFEGYDEYVGGRNIDNRGSQSVYHMLTHLPGSFCLYKPANNLMDEKKLLAKAEAGKVWYSDKKDGLAYWIVVDYYGNLQFYSRRSRLFHDKEGPQELPDGTLDYSVAIPWRNRFPHLVESLEHRKLPPGTLLAAELIGPDPGALVDDFIYVSSVTKSLTDRALELQNEKGWLKLYIWDVAFFGGEDWVSTKPVRERYGHIPNILAGNLTGGKSPMDGHIKAVRYTEFQSVDQAIAHAREAKIEGFVVVDPDGVYGDKAWNLKGKPDRPGAFCAKLKPRQEDDFVLMWDPENKIGTYGSGRHEKNKLVTLPDGSSTIHGGIGSVGLFQYNSRGELVYCCDCSSGMDYMFQANLRRENFPAVAQIEYVERTYQSDGDKTNALRFPTFVRLRRDKQPTECVNPRLDPRDE